LNGWTTTTRCHELPPLSCILGCTAADSMAHYLVCPAFNALGAEVAMSSLSDYLPHKLALWDPTPEAFLVLAHAYRVYHTLKQGRRAEISQASSTGDYSRVLQSAAQISALVRFEFAPILASAVRKRQLAGARASARAGGTAAASVRAVGPDTASRRGSTAMAGDAACRLQGVMSIASS
jgi:hypothetical protein